MIAFIIDNEELDLFPNTVLEIEQNNIFLQFDETIRGDYSLPFSLPPTEKNIRLLKFAFRFQTKIEQSGVSCSCMSNGKQHSTGTLKIEQSSTHLNFISKSKINVYYLFGISDFYQGIKGVRLRKINFGGTRSFSSGGNDSVASWTEVGWWAHVNEVLRQIPGTFDYAIYPVHNELFKGPDEWHTAIVPNNSEYVSGTLRLSKFGFNSYTENPIVLFPYLKQTLAAIGTTIGWTIAGDILDDPDFKKITILNMLAIKYTWRKKNTTASEMRMLPTINFNLADSLPDVLISEFLIALKNRFGWFYDFDFKNKIITIKSLNTAFFGSIVDVTEHTDPQLLKKIKQHDKRYALRTDFSGELANGAPDFKTVIRQPAVNTIGDLPAPNDSQYLHLRLVKNENNFYICRMNDNDIDALAWYFYTYNIYDYAPSDNTEDIKTSAGTTGNEMFTSYYDFIPRFDNTPVWPGYTSETSDWGIYLLFHHGVRNNKTGQPYSYASDHIYDSTGVQVANWALTYEFPKYNGEDVGLYNTNWKSLLTVLDSYEEIELTLYLPYIKYLQLRHDTQLIIAGVKLFIKQIKETLPYTGSVKITAVRIA